MQVIVVIKSHPNPMFDMTWTIQVVAVPVRTYGCVCMFVCFSEWKLHIFSSKYSICICDIYNPTYPVSGMTSGVARDASIENIFPILMKYFLQILSELRRSSFLYHIYSSFRNFQRNCSLPLLRASVCTCMPKLCTTVKYSI